MEFSIGQLAQRAGVKVPTIRYYEDIGLLPDAARTAGNQRRYAAEHVNRLSFIRHARELGFSVDAIRTLLQLTDDSRQSCAAVDTLARERLVEVNDRIAKLTALKSELERMIRSCAGGTIAECRIVESLSDHAHCSSEH